MAEAHAARWPDRAGSRPSSSAQARASTEHHEHHDHHVLIEPDEDRWRWRRKIRQNPRQLARLPGLRRRSLGLLLLCLGLVTGPLPGPGGIPLVLLGLAIWSSEFEWAHRLMIWFKVQLQRFQAWSRRQAGRCSGWPSSAVLRHCSASPTCCSLGVPGLGARLRRELAAAAARRLNADRPYDAGPGRRARADTMSP